MQPITQKATFTKYVERNNSGYSKMYLCTPQIYEIFQKMLERENLENVESG